MKDTRVYFMAALTALGLVVLAWFAAGGPASTLSLYLTAPLSLALANLAIFKDGISGSFDAVHVVAWAYYFIVCLLIMKSKPIGRAIWLLMVIALHAWALYNMPPLMG